MTDCAIIIVTWNSGKYLEPCIRSILDPGARCTRQLILVDNASTDGSVEQVARLFPAVRIIVNGSNRGFAAANNQGLALVDARFALLLNPDTVITPGALDAMTGFLDAHSGAWALGPMMLNGDGTPQRSGVRFPANWNILAETLFLDRAFPRSRIFGSHRELYAEIDAPRRIDYSQGSCLMVRADVLPRLGSLDERFFMYFEETDWCYRMARLGGEVWYCPSARVVHYGGGEIAHYDRVRVVEYHKSLFRFYRKHRPRLSELALRVIILMRSVLRLAMWTCVAMIRPRVAAAARSSAAGYRQVIALVFSKAD